jgi:hypothetical protein
VTQIEYYTERVKRMVGKVLTGNGITRYERGAYGLVGSAQGRGSGALLPAPGSWRPCRAITRISGPSSPKYTA